MAKNDFLARQAIARDCYFQAGGQAGRQQIIDVLALVLRDPLMWKRIYMEKEGSLKL